MTRLILGFIAGFVATLIFHQGGLTVMNVLDLTARQPFSQAPTQPFGVPQVWSLAFWGGVWGVLLALLLRMRAFPLYLLAGLVFGALLPTAVALFVVMPLKGQPVAAGGDVQVIQGALILNGLWGLGTALFIRLLRAR